MKLNDGCRVNSAFSGCVLWWSENTAGQAVEMDVKWQFPCPVRSRPCQPEIWYTEPIFHVPNTHSLKILCWFQLIKQSISNKKISSMIQIDTRSRTPLFPFLPEKSLETPWVEDVTCSAPKKNCGQQDCSQIFAVIVVAALKDFFHPLFLRVEISWNGRYQK